MQATIWALLPPVIAIVLALLTKEVYSSLLVGILAGALIYTGFDVIAAIETTFGIMADNMSINILIFLVLLGILVALITKSGASAAYGRWATKAIKNKRGALLATMGLGALIFVDDYFNCLTVGAVMRPVTDRYGIARAKLAYIIDSTAAPVCIIAPISSWAAAVTSYLPENSGIDGLTLFMQTIPYNLYALLTIFMVLALIVLQFDFGPMKKYAETHQQPHAQELKSDSRGKVIDLVLPVVVLIAACVWAMYHTGVQNTGTADASLAVIFGNCSSSLALVIGSFIALVFTFVLYLPRKVLSFKQFTDCFVEGLKAMSSAILILCLAWTLSGVCSADYLDAGGFVKAAVEGAGISLGILPAVFFLAAMGLAFSTGTSWGTFGILIPIAMAVVGTSQYELLTVTIASALAGAVFGDHVSPISDTTILSSAGAECQHLDHVGTQIPYALTVAACSFVGFLVAGFTLNWILSLAVGIVLLAAILGFFYLKEKKGAKA